MNFRIEIKPLQDKLHKPLISYISETLLNHSNQGRSDSTKIDNMYWGKLNEFAQCEIFQNNNIEIFDPPTLAKTNAMLMGGSDYSLKINNQIYRVDAKSYRVGFDSFVYARKPIIFSTIILNPADVYIVSELSQNYFTIKGYMTPEGIDKAISLIKPYLTLYSGTEKYYISLSNIRDIRELLNG